jgi:branched-chain amino acid transport system substrate-binding protein
MKMRELIRGVTLTGVALLCLLLVGCGAKPPQSAVIKLGADFSLTGKTAFWSQQVRKGLDLGIDEINSQAGPSGAKVEVVYEDNQGSPANAVTAWQKLDQVDNVPVVIAVFTPICEPLRANAAASKLPLLATVTSGRAFAALNEWSFRDFVSQDQQCPALARYVCGKLGIKTAGYLVVNDDYGLDGAKAFSEAFEKLGGKMLKGDVFNQTDTDMRSQITKILAQKPDAVLVIGRSQSLAASIIQIREQAFKGRILGVNSFDTEEVRKQVGNAGEGVVFSSSYVDFEGDPAAQAMKAAFLKRYNEAPDYITAYGYSVGEYLGKVLQQTGNDRTKVREALASLNVESIRGTLKTSPTRDILSPIGIYEYVQGKNVLKEKID